MRPLVAAVLAMLGSLVVVTPVTAKQRGGAILWEDSFSILEMAASDGAVAAVGTIPNGAGARTSVVRMYDAAKGKLLWQDIVAAQTVTLDGDRVVVAGEGGVRGYDAKKGRLEWQDAPPFSVTQLSRDEGTTLATAVSDDGASVRLRTYQTKRGTVLVADRTFALSGPLAPVAFGGGKMFVVTQGEAVQPGGFVVRPCKVTAYSIATGQQLWETTQPFSPPLASTSFCIPLAIFADRAHVVLGGAGHFGDEFMAQGYDARTGVFLWEHLSGIGTCCFDAVVTLDVEQRLVFVGGWTQNPFQGFGRQDFVIHALKVGNGDLRWEQRSPGADCPPPTLCQFHATLVVADSGTVYGAGFQVDSGASLPGTGFLRAYEARSGQLRWEDDDVDVLAMSATRGAVIVLTPGATEDEVVLRAYDGN
jgi:outer membrane protein assembly factor BamB